MMPEYAQWPVKYGELAAGIELNNYLVLLAFPFRDVLVIKL